MGQRFANVEVLADHGRTTRAGVPSSGHRQEALSAAYRFGWERAVLASELKSSARLVGLAMAVYADASGGSIYPGNVALAKGTGHNEKTVRRALAELRETGFVQLERRGNRRAGRADEWRLTLPTSVDTMPTDQKLLVDINDRSGGHHAHPTDPPQQTSLNRPVEAGTGEGLSEREIEANMASAPSFYDEPQPLLAVSAGASHPPPSSPVPGLHDLADLDERRQRARHEWDNREHGLDRFGDPLRRKTPMNRRRA